MFYIARIKGAGRHQGGDGGAQGQRSGVASARDGGGGGQSGPATGRALKAEWRQKLCEERKALGFLYSAVFCQSY